MRERRFAVKIEAMRNLGGILLLLGVLGFFYASSQLSDLEPLPEGATVSEGLQRPTGRWQFARYGCAAAAGFGLLLALSPRR
jgi:hypothetical protein